MLLSVLLLRRSLLFRKSTLRLIKTYIRRGILPYHLLAVFKHLSLFFLVLQELLLFILEELVGGIKLVISLPPDMLLLVLMLELLLRRRLSLGKHHLFLLFLFHVLGVSEVLNQILLILSFFTVGFIVDLFEL